MKTIFASLLIVLSLNSYGQNNKEYEPKSGFGVTIGYTSGKYLTPSLYVKAKRNLFTLGVAGTGVVGDTRVGKTVDKQLTNYGKTVIGNGSHTTLVFLGYGRELLPKLILEGQVWIGAKHSYTNFSDMRFNGGGYNMNTAKKSYTSSGVNLIYIPFKYLSVYGGYNILAGYGGGVGLNTSF